MSLDDWVLALHVLSAFVLVAGMVVFWVLAFAPSDGAAGTIAQVGNAAAGVGSVGTLAFGIWLALSVGGYDLWDGWIVGAFVLWAIGVGTGMRSGAAFARGRRERAVALHALSSVAVLLVLADMIWKPGA